MKRLAALALLLAPSLFGQGPAADWRTVTTPHFRVHYPREYEEWSLRAASRLESIHERVSREVGFTPPQVIDVLVVNPIAQPNGSAWPLLSTPRMIFFTEPPGPDEQIGAYGHWIDLLSVHETAHIVHMLRPSRNPFSRFMEKSILPYNPILLRAPRWVLEGYATVVEGRLTGAGRPSSTVRALILRRWAQSGRLPSYGQLNSDRRFLGMSMAYLMGSAYLEWLEQRAGSDALRNLWARMTARHRRSFGEAFTGVFGESPDRLYGRFVAELTASAMAIDRAGELQEGELWQETPRASGDPAVSPDGKEIAVVIRDRDKPQRLVIWSTEEATEEEKKFEERLKKILERDPEDVPPVRTKPLPRKIKDSLTMPDGGDIESPRWTRDGALLFSHRAPDAEGFLHFDLYRWDRKQLTRITHLADVRDADPFPDGRTAVAVRSRFGASQLVTVDLTTGAVTPRTDPSIDVVYSHPRVSPDGSRVAYVAHRGGAWTLHIDDTPVAIDGDASSPEWLSNTELVLTVSKAGFAELVRYPDLATLTRTAGGAFSPAPAPDGRVFFMTLDPDGYVLRVSPLSPQAGRGGRGEGPPLVPAIPPSPPLVTPFEVTQLSPPREYALGRQEPAWLLGQSIAPDHQALELGVRLGDIVGRLDTLLIASLGRDGAPDGGALATAWRGWPVEIHAHVFHADGENGLELRGLWTRRFPRSRLTLEGGALSDDLVFAGARFGTRQVRGTWRIDEAVRVDVDSGDDDTHYRAVLEAALRTPSFRVGAQYRRDGGAPLLLGGLASSILPRSAYARRVLDPALPVAALAGEDYDGWRIETTLPRLPFTAFYQRHAFDSSSLSLVGLTLETSADPNPILKLPGVDFTAGVARVLDEPFRGDTQWWLGMRWRP